MTFDELLQAHIKQGIKDIVAEEIEKAVEDATKRINERLRDHAAKTAIRIAQHCNVTMDEKRILVECRIPEKF